MDTGRLVGSCVCLSVSSSWTVLLPQLLSLLFWRWGQNLQLMLGKYYTAELQPFLDYNLSLQITYLTGCFETLFKTRFYVMYV